MPLIFIKICVKPLTNITNSVIMYVAEDIGKIINKRVDRKEYAVSFFQRVGNGANP